MKTVLITCDTCLCDLTESGGIDTYRLHLTSEKLPNNSDTSLDMYVPNPKIDEYYCDRHCLKKKI